MVSLIADGHSSDENGRPFRRRRALPVVALLGVLAVLGSVLWFRILTKDEVLSATVTCNLPQTPATLDPDAPAPQPLGAKVNPDTMLDVEPAALSATRVRVFNANGERGQAAHVASQLSDYGFASAPDVQVGNDPVYVDQNMQCQGQIRFGPNGMAAASTLWLIEPCAELIQDERADDSVDLALGTYFRELQPNTDAEEVLASLKNPAPGGSATAPVDIDLLKAARTTRC
ncbi:envelope integrity protein Cei [Rhodococcus tukisamuensis]|uniref:LytR cell envelope-related transcriptional attenuator n=1 Tax=Rhodococcus tukisamuensis TaxID=168276 RepID=A0A1G6QXW5_9NOCA|nr:envelope integrity protein Cei [Rhodococcus tukisamuensis]SDC96625.1 LytR cell envelope-related transcriptional attenuator [Rhodococcus tukisamuensis]